MIRHRVGKLALVIIVQAAALSAQEMVVSSFRITGVNPASTEFPAGRGTDEMVMYTPDWKTTQTGTNAYGAEAEVRGSIVQTNGGNNRQIPRDGFILSGHGVAAHWVQSIHIGDSIVVRNDSCIVLATAMSIRLKSRAILQMLKNRSVSSNWLQTLRSRERGRIEFHDLDDWKHQHRELDSLYAMAYASSMKTQVGEWRGVWHRPQEYDVEAVDAVVRRVAHGHLNAVFLETFWNGMTVYPSELADQRKEFVGFDVLRAYIDAGRKYGVQIHAWVHTFFLGYIDSSKNMHERSRKLEEHPEWLLIHRNGKSISSLEPGYIWACPANPAVQEYVGSIYREIVRKYSVDGIQHDYIRYPSSGTADENSCYCGYCRSAVRLAFGFDLMELSRTDTVKREQWNRWKESRITDFVKSVRLQLPKTTLSAAVFPDIGMTRKDKMQDWSAWTKDPLVTLLSPMCYTSSREEVESGLREMRRLSNNVPVAAGLAPFIGLRTDQLLEQIETSRSSGSNGVIFFELTTISDLSMSAFAYGPFRAKTKPPIFE